MQNSTANYRLSHLYRRMLKERYKVERFVSEGASFGGTENAYSVISTALLAHCSNGSSRFRWGEV